MFTRLFSKSSLIRNQFKLCTQSKYLLNKRFFYNTPKLFAEEESHEDKEIVNLVTIYQEVEEEQAKSKISMTSTNIFAGIEIEDGLEAISDRLWENYPEDELQEVMPKKLHVYITGEGRTRAYNERVDRVDLLTHEGEVGILPGYPTTGFILEPGLIRLVYNEQRVEYYFSSGGVAWVFPYGPMLLFCGEVYHLNDYDLSLVKKELIRLRKNLKSRDPVKVMHAEVGVELLEELEKALEELEDNRWG